MKLGLDGDYIGVLYRDTGKENGNYYNGFHRDFAAVVLHEGCLD